LLDAAGVEPLDIGIRRATLDDVFLKLTGEATGSDEDDAAKPAADRGRRSRRDNAGGSR
jgi:ABC-2 type transport system ATP-binding protein